ncbi:hypothetical protein E2C01_059515 [Portunus trituberculatus]|uniref:Uncharacterized protein n=1 Tax=Portunus trituberculatus TaxID=210409 RepID=A0A5B7GYE4_PORTR|nr:hypothetical protein [Portunus trituberculatus]
MCPSTEKGYGRHSVSRVSVVLSPVSPSLFPALLCSPSSLSLHLITSSLLSPLAKLPHTLPPSLPSPLSFLASSSSSSSSSKGSLAPKIKLVFDAARERRVSHFSLPFLGRRFKTRQTTNIAAEIHIMRCFKEERSSFTAKTRTSRGYCCFGLMERFLYSSSSSSSFSFLPFPGSLSFSFFPPQLTCGKIGSIFVSSYSI